MRPLASEAVARGRERALGVKTQCKSQLVLELLGEGATLESTGDASNENGSVRSPQSAVLETPAHHGSRPPMPQPFGLGQDELHTPLYCDRLTGLQGIRPSVQLAFRDGRELNMGSGNRDQAHVRSNVGMTGGQ